MQHAKLLARFTSGSEMEHRCKNLRFFFSIFFYSYVIFTQFFYQNAFLFLFSEKVDFLRKLCRLISVPIKSFGISLNIFFEEYKTWEENIWLWVWWYRVLSMITDEGCVSRGEGGGEKVEWDTAKEARLREELKEFFHQPEALRLNFAKYNYSSVPASGNINKRARETEKESRNHGAQTTE